MTHHDNKKRPYVKPSMTVYPLESSTRLLQASSSMPIDPTESAEQW